MKIIVVDGGGTSTDFASFDFNSGELISSIRYESSHIMQVGPQKMGEILVKGASEIGISNGDFLVFGLAGYGKNKDLVSQIDTVIADKFHNFSYKITGDVDLAYYSEFEKSTGILIILGTGSIAFKYKNGEYKRAGGWGYRLGDEASGYYLGSLLLNAFTKQADGRREKTLLYHRVKERLSLSEDYDIIKVNMDMGRDDIAALSYTVFDLYNDNDPEAINIINHMTDEIKNLILALDDGDIDEVVLFGGLTNAKIDLDIKVQRKITNKIKVRNSANNPCYGGYLMAKELMEKK